MFILSNTAIIIMVMYKILGFEVTPNLGIKGIFQRLEKRYIKY